LRIIGVSIRGSATILSDCERLVKVISENADTQREDSEEDGKHDELDASKARIYICRDSYRRSVTNKTG